MTNIVRILFVPVCGTQLAVGQTATQAKSTDYAGLGARVVQKLAAGEFSAVTANFDAQMAKDLPQAKLSALWKELLAQAGPFPAIVLVPGSPLEDEN